MKTSPFFFLATFTMPVAVLVELETSLLGHELTWFGRLSPLQAAWLRHLLVAMAVASVVMAIIDRWRQGAA